MTIAAKMKTNAISASLALATALWGGAALAQEAAASDEATPAEPQAVEQVATGPKITTQWHGDWLVECYEPALQNVNCQIKQRVVQQNGEQNILVMSIAHDPTEAVDIIQYVLPLDFLITPGVSIEIGAYQSVAGVNRCSVQGCFIEGTTDADFIQQMKAAREGGRVVIVARTGQKIGIGFSAAGFTAAYDQMVAENTRLSAAQDAEATGDN